MKTKIVAIGACLLAALLVSSCTKTTPTGNTTPLASTISGIVERSDDLSRVPNVIVYDIKGTAASDTTKSDGTFRLRYQLTDNYTGTLVASRVTFGGDTINFTLKAGANDTLPRILIIKADTSSQKTRGIAGKVASIVLVAGGDVSSISIRGTGFTESAPFTFEARDSLGLPAGASNQTRIFFSILGGPGGSEYVYPTSSLTDLTGRVVTRVTSGSKPGVLQVYAYAKPDTSNPNYIVTSSPIRLTISGGLPDSAHFSMSVQTLNLAGMLFDNLRDNIKVIVGDKNGNPVQLGTAIYFKTSAGLIQPSAVTDKDGNASVSLISANPRPASGRVNITATTIGDSGRIVAQTTQVIFSGSTLITPPAGNFAVPDSGSYLFNYVVSDALGNPIVGKSTVVITVSGPGSGDLQVSGDANVTIPDAAAPGIGVTQFRATLNDKSRGGPSGLVNVKISVTSDPASGNGNASATFSGIQIGSGGASSSSAQASSITLSSLNPSGGSLAVRGTGSVESARLTFTVRDSTGNPVVDPLGIAPKVYVVFSVSPNLGGGEFIFPSADSTNGLGQVSTTFNAGTKSGVIQVTAQTISGARVINAAPVAITISGGLPDVNHFTTTLSKINMPGLVKTGSLGTVNVLVGDSAGNPAQSGTKLYFSTTGGVISAEATTDGSGQASASLQGGLPAPNNGGPGLGLVSVFTVGKGGVLITKQLQFLFSGSPLIFGPASGFQIADSGQISFTYKVADLNGNPMSSGTSISVAASGVGAGGLSLKGDASRVMLDTKDPSATNFAVQVQDNHGAAGLVTFTITVSGDNGATTYNWSGTKLAKGVAVGSGGSGAGYPSSIQILNVNPAAPGPISVKGTGSSETASLSFQVKDSLGNPLDPSRATNVIFTIQNGPGGGEFVFPASATSNASGQVSTTLNAGTKAGVVQVIAQTTVGAITITSSPVQMTIASSLADPNHFTVWEGSHATNIPVAAAPMFQKQVALIEVLAGDRYGNPAQSTAVYFSSNGGVIKASAITDAEGSTTPPVPLLGGRPFPSGGVDTVTISSAGENGQSIVRTLIFTGSGDANISVPAYPSGILPNLADGAFLLFNFDVKDANNNPIAAGNTISVSATGDPAVVSQLGFSINGSGSSTLTTDTRDTSKVHFQLKVADNSAGAGAGGAFTLTITSNGPNGANITRQLSGFLQAPGVIGGGGGGGTGFAANISLIRQSTTKIAVQSTGSITTSATLVYQATDINSNPVDVSHAAMMKFAISGPSLGATLTVDSVLTDASGTATTLVRAGTQAGVIQILTSTVVSGITIKALPVTMVISGGLPDQRHFTISAGQYNFPGLDFNALTDQITVQMADLWGNPVQPSVVSFSTSNQHGTIESNGILSNADGFVTTNLFSSNPRPVGSDAISLGQGYSRVYGITKDVNQNNVEDSVTLIWSGAPIITETSGPATYNGLAPGAGAGPWTFTVADRLGHVLSKATSISVAGNGITVLGQSSVTLPDLLVGGSGFTSFTISIQNSNPGPALTQPVPSILMVTVIHPVYGTFTLPLATGSAQ